MRLQKNTPKKSKKLIILVVALLLIGSYIAIAYTKKLMPFANDTQESSSFINHEKSAAEKAKEEELKSNPSIKHENQSDTPATPAVDPDSGKQRVNVSLSGVDIYDGNVEARGLVTNSVENSGSCTYIFTMGSTVVKKQTTPMTNPTSTTCKAIIFAVENLASGSWKVALEFSSAISYGISNQREVLIP